MEKLKVYYKTVNSKGTLVYRPYTGRPNFSNGKKSCPECKHEMNIEFDKYVNVTVWVCPHCGEEIYICDNGC